MALLRLPSVAPPHKKQRLCSSYFTARRAAPRHLVPARVNIRSSRYSTANGGKETPNGEQAALISAVQRQAQSLGPQLVRELQEKLHISKLEDWYTIPQSTIIENLPSRSDFSGHAVFRAFDESMVQLLASVYPDHDWQPWRFVRVPKSYWSDPAHQRHFIRQLLKDKFGSTQDVEQFYQLSSQDIIDAGGSRVLTLHGSSHYKLATAMFPDITWLPWKFSKVWGNYWDDPAHLAQWLAWLRVEIKADKLEDLYQVTGEVVQKYNGPHFGAKIPSVHALVSEVYPSHPWMPWKFKSTARGWWNNHSNQLSYFTWFRTERFPEYAASLESLYALSISQLLQAHGGTLAGIYDNSPYKLVQGIYPNHSFLPWLFKSIPTSFAADPTVRYRYMMWLGDRLGYKTSEDWYKVTKQHFLENHGVSVIYSGNARGSPMAAVVETFPHHRFLPWRFVQVSRLWWSKIENQQEYMKWLSSELKIKTLDDWYNRTIEEVQRHRGARLLQYYGNSLSKLLRTLYPDHLWLIWKFINTPNQYWKNPDHQKQFLEWIQSEVKIGDLSGFYKLTGEDIAKYGGTGPEFCVCTPRLNILAHPTAEIGSSLIHIYGSIQRLLEANYPSHPWEAFKFARVPKFFWKHQHLQVNRDTVRGYLDWIGSEYCAIRPNGNKSELQKWYSVTRRSLPPHASTMLHTFGGLAKALSVAYPRHVWDSESFHGYGASRMQDHLFQLLVKSFPNKDFKQIQRLQVKNKHARAEIELDVLSKDLHVALEYQGERHYFDVLLYGDRQMFERTDNFKALYCALNGIHLVEVPFWWDMLEHSLRKTIENEHLMLV